MRFCSPSVSRRLELGDLPPESYSPTKVPSSALVKSSQSGTSALHKTNPRCLWSAFGDTELVFLSRSKAADPVDQIAACDRGDPGSRSKRGVVEGLIVVGVHDG